MQRVEKAVGDANNSITGRRESNNGNQANTGQVANGSASFSVSVPVPCEPFNEEAQFMKFIKRKPENDIFPEFPSRSKSTAANELGQTSRSTPSIPPTHNEQLRTSSQKTSIQMLTNDRTTPSMEDNHAMDQDIQFKCICTNADTFQSVIFQYVV